MSKNVVVKKTGDKGKGVFALKDFKKDEIILYINGKVVETSDHSSFSEYVQNHWFPFDKKGHRYKYVLPKSPWMYINHSCNPNTGIRDNRDIVAMRSIKKGEEILLDYSLNNIDNWKMECKCKSKNCRKVISTFYSLNSKTKEKYLNYVIDYIRDEYLKTKGKNLVKAFAPANISCIFSIIENNSPLKKGSLGVGFTVNKGVTVSIKKIPILKKSNKQNKIIIYFNNKKIKFPTVETVAKKLNKNKENLEIKINSDLPLSCGFGISGASALATAYTLNKLLKLKKTKKELAKIAHIAEVENKTGLGDVINQYYGGFLIRYKPSCKFKVKRLNIKHKKIYYKVFSKLDTKKIITNKKIKNKINRAGIESLKKISSLKKPSLNKIIKISKEFSIDSNLLKNKDIIKLIDKIEKNNGSASMIMLGNAVFSNKRFKGSKELKITDKGACSL